MAASVPRKAKYTWAELEKASATNMGAGPASSRGATTNVSKDPVPENAFGISATVFSIVGRKGSREGTCCNGLLISLGSCCCIKSL